MTIKTTTKGYSKDAAQLGRRIEAARGSRLCDLVIRNVRWLDVFTGCWRSGDVAVFEGSIVGVSESYDAKSFVDGTGFYLVPGFIDSHVHIESSMMTPKRFSESVLPRGTTTVLWDPHEIANVKGLAGIRWAISAAEREALDIFVMIPSCVPSTPPELKLETSGSYLDAATIQEFASSGRVYGLAEMMNWPGLLSGDSDVLTKLWSFQSLPRDGHCPELSGKDLNAYATAGIHSCHESTRFEEGQEKLAKGIRVLIREGSCAKDADALLPLLTPRSSASLSFCSDDRNPLDIEEAGHIDCIVNKGLALGIDPIEVFRSASYSAAVMYHLGDRGAVAPGYLADLVLLQPVVKDNWQNGFRIAKVFKRGVDVSELRQDAHKSPVAEAKPFQGKNLNLGAKVLTEASLKIPAHRDVERCHVIGVRPRQIVTDHRICQIKRHGGVEIQADLARDIIKIAVFERHLGSGESGVALVQGFGLKSGAIATSINHDCHNIIATGSSDALILRAIQELCSMDGGIIVVSDDGQVERLPLPIGGLMTSAAPAEISEALRKLKALALAIGCPLEEPFLQLSFLALPVIPSLKITDQGLVAVDTGTFKIIPVVEKE